jgi:hypothetical protein
MALLLRPKSNAIATLPRKDFSTKALQAIGFSLNKRSKSAFLFVSLSSKKDGNE